MPASPCSSAFLLTEEQSRGPRTLPGPCQTSQFPQFLFLLVVQGPWAYSPLCNSPRKHPTPIISRPHSSFPHIAACLPQSPVPHAQWLLFASEPQVPCYATTWCAPL